MRRLGVRLFERYVFRAACRRRWLRARRDDPGAWAAFEEALRGLDTPWRVGSFLESCFRSETDARLFDVPRPPVVTWRSGTGTSLDFAALALEAFAQNGREARLLTCYQQGTLAPASVCAVHEEGVGWHHLSSAGMFGVYATCEEIAEDLVGAWWLCVVRLPTLEIADWRERR